jgi:hypothetical protein
MPVWCVWHENALFFSTDASSRKARNFTANPAVAISTDGADASVIVEGVVSPVESYGLRVQICELYSVKYGMSIRATATGITFDDVYAPLYVVTPTLALGVTDEVESRMTRWRFGA